MPPPTPNPDDWLERFLAAYPQYRTHVTWREEHGGYAMPAWLADQLRLWIAAQVEPGHHTGN